jgi:lysozyme
LWLAQYTSGTPSWPVNTWPTYSLWQWTDQETCQGVVGAIDANQFNGSQENCLKWMGPAQPAPPPSEQIVDIAFTVPDGVMVKVSINGEVVW